MNKLNKSCLFVTSPPPLCAKLKQYQPYLLVQNQNASVFSELTNKKIGVHRVHRYLKE
uniref:Uncharacterized protein n=1 Tax=Arundo donax TaxID=35708 RepID=A0A0A9CTU6_ARUDO